MDNTCICCGRVIPEGRHICLQCGDYDDQQRFISPKPQIRTNGDRIRSMTDEQLIPVIFSYACHQVTEARAGCPCDECDDCIRAWLKQEAQHDPD